MSIQMPQRPEGTMPTGSSDVRQVRSGSAHAQSRRIDYQAPGTAAQLALSHAARLTNSFSARQSTHGVAAGLLYTHGVLDASHAALQRESRIFDRQA